MLVKKRAPPPVETYLENSSALSIQFPGRLLGPSRAAFGAKFSLVKDTTASFTKELQSNLAAINNGFEKYQSTEKSSKTVTEWLNTDEASAIFAAGDFYLPEMYEMKNFPKEEMLSKIHWWIMRNKGMCDNVVNRARAAEAKKVVVIVGASHKKYMQDIFKTMPNVRVRNISES